MMVFIGNEIGTKAMWFLKSQEMEFGENSSTRGLLTIKKPLELH